VTPAEHVGYVAFLLFVAFAGAWATASEREHGLRSYKRPRLAAPWFAASAALCVYGASEKGPGSWTGLGCAALAVAGAWWALGAAAQAWVEWSEPRRAAASRKAGGR